MDGIARVGERQKDVGAQNETVIHSDRDVPFDTHSVSDFVAGLQGCVELLKGCVHAHDP